MDAEEALEDVEVVEVVEVVECAAGHLIWFRILPSKWQTTSTEMRIHLHLHHACFSHQTGYPFPEAGPAAIVSISLDFDFESLISRSAVAVYMHISK